MVRILHRIIYSSLRIKLYLLVPPNTINQVHPWSVPLHALRAEPATRFILFFPSDWCSVFGPISYQKAFNKGARHEGETLYRISFLARTAVNGRLSDWLIWMERHFTATLTVKRLRHKWISSVARIKFLGKILFSISYSGVTRGATWFAPIKSVRGRRWRMSGIRIHDKSRCSEKLFAFFNDKHSDVRARRKNTVKLPHKRSRQKETTNQLKGEFAYKSQGVEVIPWPGKRIRGRDFLTWMED